MNYTITLPAEDWRDIAAGLAAATPTDAYRPSGRRPDTSRERWDALSRLILAALDGVADEPGCCRLPGGQHAVTCPAALARTCDDCLAGPGEQCLPGCSSYCTDDLPAEDAENLGAVAAPQTAARIEVVALVPYAATDAQVRAFLAHAFDPMVRSGRLAGYGLADPSTRTSIGALLDTDNGPVRYGWIDRDGWHPDTWPAGRPSTLARRVIAARLDDPPPHQLGPTDLAVTAVLIAPTPDEWDGKAVCAACGHHGLTHHLDRVTGRCVALNTLGFGCPCLAYRAPGQVAR